MDSVKLEYSLQTEAKSLVHAIFGVSNGFYIKNGWYVLPTKTAYLKDRSTVYLPKMDYTILLGSYVKISETDKINNNSDVAQNNKAWVNALEDQLKNNKLYINISTTKKQKLLTEYQQLLFPAIKKLKLAIPLYKNKEFNIIVNPTNFGVGLSFTVLRNKSLQQKNIDINIKIRNDVPLAYLIEGLASSVSRGLYEKDVNNIGWRETESISDFLTKYVFEQEDCVPTLSVVSKRKIKLLEQSLNYLISLNAPTGVPFKYVESTNTVMLFEDNITSDFTPYEFKALRALLKNRNKTITFDQISEQLYGEETDIKFTIWGITKTIQRIRDKLQNYGLPRDIILNVKGQGFKLLE
ncbi:winged helix-turn-helix transcriptional regulator [bacterium]|nr:winged helix-turn-helix transcriptional regulator [bacterium]